MNYQLPFWNAIILGSMVGFLVLYAAFQHNPQGEFHTLGAVNLGHSSALFLLTVIPVAVIVFSAELAFHGILRWLGVGNTTKGLRIILLPGLDAIILGVLASAWISNSLQGDSGIASDEVAVIATIVFFIELIVQLIARSVRRAQANARANRIEP